MARRSWFKYLAIAAAFAGVGARVLSWVNSAQSEASPGGEDFTAGEIAQLDTVITDAINEGLRAAEVPLMATVTMVAFDE